MNEEQTGANPPRFELLIGDCDSWVYRACCAVGSISEESHALHNLKNIVDKILEAISPDSLAFYLSSERNFRYAVAKQRPYKGNRKQPKPAWYEEARGFLVNNWGAEITDNIEADDACAIAQMEALDKGTLSVIVSNDKDLLQVPGWNYNWVKCSYLYQSPSAAERFFWKQMLTGDPVDNVQGVPKIGEKKAEAILSGDMDTELMGRRVAEEYMRYYGSDWEDVFHENKSLLQLLTSRGEADAKVQDTGLRWV